MKFTLSQYVKAYGNYTSEERILSHMEKNTFTFPLGKHVSWKQPKVFFN